MNTVTKREAEKVMKKHGFRFNRSKGDHYIYVNSDTGHHISIAYNQGKSSCNGVIWLRICKENGFRYK